MLHRHLEILEVVLNQEPIGIVKLSNQTGNPKHEVRYSLWQLEEQDLIEPSAQGARTTEQAPALIEDHDKRIDDLQNQTSTLEIDIMTPEKS